MLVNYNIFKPHGVLVLNSESSGSQQLVGVPISEALGYCLDPVPNQGPQNPLKAHLSLYQASCKAEAAPL